MTAGMLGLVVPAALMCALAAALVLARARAGVAAAAGPSPEIAVHRRALAEIDELAERGLLAPEERAAARAEAGRRLLRAADRAAPETPMTAAPRWVLAAAATAAPVAAMVLYLVLAAPVMGDQPFAARLAAWRADPESATPPELAAALRQVAVQRPTDPEPLRRLAMVDLSLGDADGAIHALRRAIQLAPGRADLMDPLGEVMVLRDRGQVGPEAQAVFQQTLAIGRASPTARYYLASAKIAGGDTAGGLAAWRALLADLAPDDPRRSLLAADIARVEAGGSPEAQDAGVPAPQVLAGAIAGMVQSLAARLEAHPNDPAGWVRLVRAYGVLREYDRQAAALAEARRMFAGRPDILAALAAARRPPS